MLKYAHIYLLLLCSKLCQNNLPKSKKDWGGRVGKSDVEKGRERVGE